MLLNELMDDAVADVVADPALAVASRRQGLSIRRTRRALATVGAMVVVGAGTALALPGGADSAPVARDVPRSVQPAPLSGEMVPITGPGAAAALAAAVEDVSSGTVSRLQGDTGPIGPAEASAELLLLPDTSSGPAGRVMVNLQPLSLGGPTPYTCDARYMTRCDVRTLPGGDTLRTYHDDADTEYGAASQRAVAEVLSPSRHLRVVVFAMNGNAFERGSFRDETVLDIDQLVAVATLPWWSRTELPREYVEAGANSRTPS
ncbi:hypothetical protein [Nocardioides flavescens]|uniref:Uncharacterized protein n=1 Tax=Nocardioides flavescens TaxID=2691959 RepID=A0A6L7ERW6_9ACTN|nr:hypothetical protein [Nocardioides flavescens]MXG89420.1 hypothetical protein [Nocardioides flavescens]